MSKSLIGVGAAVLIGIALRFVLNLDPVWWLAWFVPGLLLALSLRFEGWSARGLVLLAAAIGVTANFTYFRSVMPLAAVVAVMGLQSLLWLLTIGLARRIVLRFRAGWTVLALPVIAVAVDTALANFTPDGNWGSVGYTQAEMLPIAQIASVFGVGGIVFLLMLFNSALALAIHFRLELPGAKAAYAVVTAVFVAAAGYGAWRLQSPVTGREVTLGIASIDDYIREASNFESANTVWTQYDATVGMLAAGGVKVVLLPEKIDVLPLPQAQVRQAQLREIAATNKVWLVAGVGVEDGSDRYNEAWWYAPDGALVTSYRKHHMAPPEREFLPGNDHPTQLIDGVRYGVAICKDMHFGKLGRAFASREAAVMLVPAWDFDRDKFYAMNVTKMRGIESGFSIVRSSRDGLLTVTDPYGRVVEAADSEPMPGTALITRATFGTRLPTLYALLGDALGWVCLALLPLMVGGLLVPRRAGDLAKG
jgi:apolipoprotein N-acyltransferase